MAGFEAYCKCELRPRQLSWAIVATSLLRSFHTLLFDNITTTLSCICLYVHLHSTMTVAVLA